MTVSKREPSEPSPDSVIWRYMDDWKFKLLLSRFTEQKLWQPERPGRRTVYFNDPGQVWFAFPSTFGDLNETKEGMFPDANEDPEQFCDRMAAHMKLSKEDATAMKGRWLKSRTKSVRDGIFFMAQLCGVSSWNANQNESQSMWRDFVHEQNGVAIRSTCKNVEHALGYVLASPARRATPALCQVGYVDHSDYFLPYEGHLELLAIVNESYSPENEIRFIAKSPELVNVLSGLDRSLPLEALADKAEFKTAYAQRIDEYFAELTTKTRDVYRAMRESDREGFSLPVSLSELLGEVVLKPGCTSDYADAVIRQLNDAGCSNVTVRPSSLA